MGRSATVAIRSLRLVMVLGFAQVGCEMFIPPVPGSEARTPRPTAAPLASAVDALWESADWEGVIATLAAEDRTPEQSRQLHGAYVNRAAQLLDRGQPEAAKSDLLAATALGVGAGEAEALLDRASKEVARQAAQLEVVSLRCVTLAVESLGARAYAEGEVLNRTRERLPAVRAVTVWYGAEGQEVARAWAFIRAVSLLPAERSTFRVVSRHDPAMFRCEVLFEGVDGEDIASFRAD